MKFKITNAELLTLLALFKESADKYAEIIEHENLVKKANAILAFAKTDSMPDDLMPIQLYKSIFQELWVVCQKKAFDVRQNYTLKLTSSQAAAIHIEFAGIHDPATYLGCLMMKLCNSIYQKFSSQ